MALFHKSTSIILPFLSGSGETRQAVVQIPLDGIWLGAAGIRSTEHGYIQNSHNVKTELKTQLVKVLESLENFFQEVFKQGLGQRPKVFPLTPCVPAPQAGRRSGTQRERGPPRGGTLP